MLYDVHFRRRHRYVWLVFLSFNNNYKRYENCMITMQLNMTYYYRYRNIAFRFNRLSRKTQTT